MNRFQSAYAPEGASFAAYIGFYTPCNTAMIGDEKVSEKPIRVYHDIADDWVPVGPCRDYVARLKQVGANVELVEYPGAYHAFDVQTIPGPLQLPQAQTWRKCRFEEKPQGVIINSDTGQPASFSDPCISRSPITLKRPTPLARTSSNFSANFSTSSRSTENERAVNIHRRVKMGESPAQCRAFSAFYRNHSVL
jgi:hypothetical protein